ncbi:MAG TPA: glycoside hydrolase domain-containing protein [Nocardioidaceae bacterium]|nr:glycoside hydrolase domain-containing protein [Nocardioidaceae bacterium]
MFRTRARRTAVILTALATSAAALSVAAPAQAANRVTPGNFTGYGFDQCLAPTQSAMDRWLTHSPFQAVGIYISGDSRACRSQPNLTRRWISTQLANDWRLLPITLGPQASCSTRFPRYGNDPVINYRPANRYGGARKQGRREAVDAVRAAKALGISPRSTLWYDLEAFDIRGTNCRESALSFLSAWTNKLHGLDYVSGVYSSAASGIKVLDDAMTNRPGKYSIPDQVWIADWNGRADVLSSYVRRDSWMPHARVHQYRGGHNETHGGVTINIDSNFLDLGRGSVAPAARQSCGVRINFREYEPLTIGSVSARVSAIQCLLTNRRLYTGELGTRYNRKTDRAVRAYQTSHSLPVGGGTTLRTWTAILSEGRAPVVKRGSGSHPVRRLQRALNAAGNPGLKVTGVFNAKTTAAVQSFQRRRNQAQTGVAAGNTWAQLKSGRR